MTAAGRPQASNDPGAVDSHCHVFDPAHFPYAAAAVYKPPPEERGTAEQFAALLDANGVGRALLVNPTSGYGYDNRCMVAALRTSNGRFKGIARVRPDIDAVDLASLAGAGVIGVRLDLIADGVPLLQHPMIPRLFARLRTLRWQVHVQCEKDQLAQAAPALLDAQLPLVIDHCGRPDVARGPEQPGFQALLTLGREGHAVKISGPFRFSQRPSPYEDVVPYIDALLETFTPGRCVWGSDWPFLRMQDRPDYGSVAALLRRWLPNENDYRQVIAGTPRRLFAF